jgi:hypothetical protein
LRREVPQWLKRRRLAIAVAMAAAITVPLVALGAAQDWWFFRAGDAPVPVTEVTVVKTGTWDGKPWTLTAYRSGTDGICFSMIPGGAENATGMGAAMGCDQIEGVPRTPQSKPYTPHGITFLSGSSDRLPTYVVGPVVRAADEVAIHLVDGTIVRTPTFAAPDELGSAIRFYATPIREQPIGPGQQWVQELVGLTKDGRIVACLVNPMPERGVPLSACR